MKGVSGIGIGKFKGWGKIVRIDSIYDFGRIKGDEVVVTKNATPDFILILKKIKCLITDEGGATCHIAIVCRELNKAAIVATSNSTITFKDGDMVSFDTTKGIVFKQ
jgi:phosphohistidine swiveling domain-containing protein